MEAAWLETRQKFEELREIRSDCVNSLKRISDKVLKANFGTNVANITASSAGVVSSVVGIVGLALLPFTAGVSSVLIIGSAIGGGVSALTGLSALAAKMIINSNEGKEAHQWCDRDKNASTSFYESLNRFNNLKETYFQSLPENEQMQTFNENSDSNWFERTHQASSVSRVVSAGIAVPVKAASLVRIGGASTEAFATGAGRATLGFVSVARVAGIALSGAFIAVDVWSLVMSAIDVHQGSKTQVIENIAKIVEDLECEVEYYSTVMLFNEQFST